VKLLFFLAHSFVVRYQRYRSEAQKRRFAACGDRVFLSPHAVIWGEANVKLGSDVAIHSFTHMFGGGGITIGDRTQISALCSIASITHSDDVAKRTIDIERSVNIGDDVWIGTAAVILPGVSIGNGSIIGAGAVVTKDVPPYSVAVGNPAVIRRSLERTSQ
jgi:maltose O-acetyltransferase